MLPLFIAERTASTAKYCTSDHQRLRAHVRMTAVQKKEHCGNGPGRADSEPRNLCHLGVDKPSLTSLSIITHLTSDQYVD